MRSATSARPPRTPRRSPAPVRASGPSAVADDRRTRLRLRELCDEVLASHRVAAERDLFTDADRREAQAITGLSLAARGG